MPSMFPPDDVPTASVRTQGHPHRGTKAMASHRFAHRLSVTHHVMAAIALNAA
jgi:hypothetical protein